MFRPRCSTKMHHMPGLSAASLQAFARLNDCSNWDRLTLRSFKRKKLQSLYYLDEFSLFLVGVGGQKLRSCPSNQLFLLTSLTATPQPTMHILHLLTMNAKGTIVPYQERWQLQGAFPAILKWLFRRFALWTPSFNNLPL